MWLCKLSTFVHAVAETAAPAMRSPKITARYSTRVVIVTPSILLTMVNGA